MQELSNFVFVLLKLRMQVMPPKLTALLCNRATSHIFMGSRLHSPTVVVANQLLVEVFICGNGSVKIRGGICVEMPKISIAAFAGDPTNIEPTYSAESENISYSSEATEQYTKGIEHETTTIKKLFNCEETDSAAASADVTGLAEEIQKAAKSSTDLAGECKNFEEIQSTENWAICENSRLSENEKPEIMKDLDQFPSQAIEEESSSNVAYPHNFTHAFVSKHMAKAITHSRKRTERNARRVKARSNIIKLAPAANTTFGLVDILDAERILRKPTNSKLLTAMEEIELSKRIQDMLMLERIRLRLIHKIGHAPTLDRWSQAVGTDMKTLQRRYIVGNNCMEKLLKSNWGLVRYVVNRYNGLGRISYEDLFQAGCIGLVKAIEKFDYRKGFRFSTFAYWCIRSSVLKEISSNIIAYPGEFFFDMYPVKRIRKSFKGSHGRRPTFEELARMTGLSVETLNLVWRNSRKIRPLPSNFPDPNAVDPDVEISKLGLEIDIAKALSFVTTKEREVLRQRYGFDDGRSKGLRETGYLCNYSQEGIRLIEKRALRKIRESYGHILKSYIKLYSYP